MYLVKQKLKLFVISLIALLPCLRLSAAPIRVACVGDSVTYGLHIENRESHAYPAELQRLLGGGYRVENFGLSGTTLLRKGHSPYVQTGAFWSALAFRPDVVIVDLGLNDTDPRDWPDYRDDFSADYSWLIGQFRQANPEVQVYVAIITPVFAAHPRFKSGTREWTKQIRDQIQHIAQANRARTIDFYRPLQDRPDLFPDALHPNAEGASILALTAYRALTGDFGGLHLPEGFGDHMVLPYGRAVLLGGQANLGALVTVDFEGKHIEAKVGADGRWSIPLPAQPAGGPHRLRFHTEQQTIELQDVYFGELWLCSGQSNMDFPISKAVGGEALLQMKDKPLVRVLHYRNAAQTDTSAWDGATLDKVNRLQFFSGEWQQLDAAGVSDFSAVGLSFALELSRRLGLPIGIVQVTVGGSNAESWIDRRTIEEDPRLVDLLLNWRNSDWIMPWCRERAAQNLAKANNPLQRHPYEPAYNYEAGIAPLANLPFCGVIWYQGESNTHNLELYGTLFSALVESWRKLWGQELPFLSVQLSGMNRPSWPEFRNLQLHLADVVPHTGMVVSSDLGEAEQVHYANKKPVGDRLARLALETVYKLPDAHGESPVGWRAGREGDALVVQFRNAGRNLKTSDGQPARGFEVRDLQGNWHVAAARIDADRIVLKLPADENLDAVAYAWQPYTDANLLNQYDLPASTFFLRISKGKN